MRFTLRLYLSVWMLVAMQDLHAQQKYTDYVNLDLAVGNSRGSVSFSYLHDWRLGARQKIGMGLGTRFTSFFGTNLYYLTAPAELTSGSTGPFVIFKENIEENIDSLFIKSPQVNSLNLLINLDYHFGEKVIAGFNIDFIGFSFGGSKNVNYINGSSGTSVGANPTTFNLLLISDNDLGTLNSELYLKYLIKPVCAVKASAQFLFTEYTTETNVQQYPAENDRFRNKSLMFSIGISRKL